MGGAGGCLNGKRVKGNMVTLLKLVAGAAIALSILHPSFTPRADGNCECKAKSTRMSPSIVPHADTCECKAKGS